jgi:hypothetical protein
MFKILGGVLLGMFLGGLVIEALKRHHPELLEGIEKQTKKTVNRLFDNLRETYDFRETGTDKGK